MIALQLLALSQWLKWHERKEIPQISFALFLRCFFQIIGMEKLRGYSSGNLCLSNNTESELIASVFLEDVPKTFALSSMLQGISIYMLGTCIAFHRPRRHRHMLRLNSHFAHD